MADKPFRVGERIIFSKHDGVVEDIGLRSTKIRLLTGPLVIIPNDELARHDIQNVGRRPYIRRSSNILIPLDTPLEKLEKAIHIIRKTLENHEGMDPEQLPKVYFTEFEPTAFNIRMIYWYKPPDYWNFLKFNEEVNLQICRAFDEQGIHFSLPARISHTSNDGQERSFDIKTQE